MGNHIGPDGLTPKMRAFCHEYVKDGNGAAAAIRAGCKPSGARYYAHRALKRPEVMLYLSKVNPMKTIDDLNVTSERVLRELARLAFHDIGSYFKTVKGKEVPKKLSELTADQRAAISEYDGTNRKMKLYNKDPSLDKLGRHLKLFTELHENQLNFNLMGNIILRDGSALKFNIGKPIPGK